MFGYLRVLGIPWQGRLSFPRFVHKKVYFAASLGQGVSRLNIVFEARYGGVAQGFVCMRRSSG